MRNSFPAVSAGPSLLALACLNKLTAEKPFSIMPICDKPVVCARCQAYLLRPNNAIDIDQTVYNIKIRHVNYCVGSAGSERVGKSEATGDRLEEAKHINKSLSALGKF